MPGVSGPGEAECPETFLGRCVDPRGCLARSAFSLVEREYVAAPRFGISPGDRFALPLHLLKVFFLQRGYLLKRHAAVYEGEKKDVEDGIPGNAGAG